MLQKCTGPKFITQRKSTTFKERETARARSSSSAAPVACKPTLVGESICMATCMLQIKHLKYSKSHEMITNKKPRNLMLAFMLRQNVIQLAIDPDRLKPM